MKIIILGAGQVGGSLAETLVGEQHDITVVDTHADRLQEYSERLDIRTIVGRCSFPEVLRQAGADSADMIIAVTDSDEVNMVACQVAYSLFHVPKKIARIRSPHYFIRKDLFSQDNLPIDVFISPEKLITENIKLTLEHPGALQVCSYGEGQLKLIIVRPYYGGILLGQSLQKIHESVSTKHAKIIAVFRHGKQLKMADDIRVEVGDEVYFIALEDHVETMMRQLRKPMQPSKRIIMAGGGNLGGAVAAALQNKYRIKLIDHNRPRCENLAETLNHVTVLCAEASDEELLINENIEHTDVFIAITNDDEANILAAIQAKKLGAKSLMALINRTAYVDLIEGGAINHVISPQYTTIGSILTHVRQGDVVTVNSLRRGQAEAIEVIAHGDDNTSSLIGNTIQKLDLPNGVMVVGIIREDKAIIPDQDFVIAAEDHLILVVFDKKSLFQLEKILQVSASFF